MYEIKNGRVIRSLSGGSVIYDTMNFWKHVIALGGQRTCMTMASAAYPWQADYERLAGVYPVKGEPPQHASNSIQAVATVVANQAVIDVRRKA
jgi:hypothetical protein